MAAFLADSSVILDVLTDDPSWAAWSISVLERAMTEGNVFIDPVVYSEISVRFSRIEDLETAFEESGLLWSEIPREALFLAGKAFLEYRRAGGIWTSPLPDFFIGAHAAVSDLTLITRDPDRIGRHFPRVRLLRPPYDRAMS